MLLCERFAQGEGTGKPVNRKSSEDRQGINDKDASRRIIGHRPGVFDVLPGILTKVILAA
jgi:hypothetical protein